MIRLQFIISIPQCMMQTNEIRYLIKIRCNNLISITLKQDQPLITLMCVCVYVCMCVCVYVCMCVCMHVYSLSLRDLKCVFVSIYQLLQVFQAYSEASQWCSFDQSIQNHLSRKKDISTWGITCSFIGK